MTFVDDCAILLYARHNSRILETVQIAVQAISTAAANRGLHINFDPGKTELLWNIIGKGAKKMEEQLYKDNNQLCWEHDGTPYALHLSHAYKHLGTWLQTKHRHAKEVQTRASAAKQQWGQLARPFFTRNTVSIKTKAAIFQSLVLSPMTYNVHTWAGCKGDDIDRWVNHLKGPIGTLLKPVLVAQCKYQHTTDQMFA